MSGATISRSTRAVQLVKSAIGVDKALRYSLLANVTTAVAGLVTVYLVTRYFTPTVQGFYYTFASILLLQTLVELGFGGVLAQFVAHEGAFVVVGADGVVVGDMRHAQRLGSLARIGLKWYAAVVCIMLIVVGTAGHLFLSGQKVPGVAFERPWWLLCFGAALATMFAPSRCFLQGTNQLARLNRSDFVILLTSALAGSGPLYPERGYIRLEL